jgi:putative transposase
VHRENFAVYGARKVWLALNREGIAVARCTVERLMGELGLRGAVRGRIKRTTIADPLCERPADLVSRRFAPAAPNRLWVADITYVSTWTGWVYVAFVVDAYARRIIGWRTSTSMTTALVLDAIEHAIRTRERTGWDVKDVVHHTDRGSQYTSIALTERLAEAGIQPSVGAVGSSYDNALAETINGLYKTEVIKPRGPWRSSEHVEFATAEWVDWFNHRRLYQRCGDIPPAEMEAAYYSRRPAQHTAELSHQVRCRGTGGGGNDRNRLRVDCPRGRGGSARAGRIRQGRHHDLVAGGVAGFLPAASGAGAASGRVAAAADRGGGGRDVRARRVRS